MHLSNIDRQSYEYQTFNLKTATKMDFVFQHKGQIGVVSALVAYSLAKKKLTPGGVAAAVATAVVHMVHPWGVFFNLLVGFFVVGTVGTKVSD